MDIDVKQAQHLLFLAPALMHASHPVPDLKVEEATSLSRIPSLEEVLEEIGPLPKETLFLGQAEDDLPILLDLTNPVPGPLLIVGEADAGKTHLLKVIARFVVSTQSPRAIQYGVITDHPEEWKDEIDAPHCVGLFAMDEEGAVDFIQALAIWSSRKPTGRQSVLLMIDGLNNFAAWDRQLDHNIQKILLDGPAKRIWPLVTFNPEHNGTAGIWLEYFHTRIYGHTRNADLSDVGFETLHKDLEFRLHLNSRWINFRIPRI